MSTETVKRAKYHFNIVNDDRSKKLIFQSDGRNHYVYRITNIGTRKHYYGSRVTKLDPYEDIGIKYFSSSSDKEFIIEQKQHPNNIKFESSHEISKYLKNVKAPTVKNWCKNSKKLISKLSYNKSIFLKSLGADSEIIGKSYEYIGFGFLGI